MGKGNEVVGMRLSPETVEKLDGYGQFFKWKPGQVLTELLGAEERATKALEPFEDGILDDGTRVIVFRDPEDGEFEMCDGDFAEKVLYWLVKELQKPLSVRFSEPFNAGKY